jgi:hypothetical protein
LRSSQREIPRARAQGRGRRLGTKRDKTRETRREERGTQRAPDYELQKGVIEDEKFPHGCFLYVHPYSSIWPKAGNS